MIFKWSITKHSIWGINFFTCCFFVFTSKQLSQPCWIFFYVRQFITFVELYPTLEMGLHLTVWCKIRLNTNEHKHYIHLTWREGGRGLWVFSESKYFFSVNFRDRIFFSIKFADRKCFFPKKTIVPSPLQVKWMFPRTW